ncbi:MAG: glycosyltransferase family 117 protein [Chloroflexia bacterium]
MNMRRRTSVPLYGVALLAALAAGALYAAGAAPGLTLRYGGSDGGELAVAVYTLGIPHPTGYPTYVLLAQAVRLFPWGTFAGRLNLFSALAGALTVGLVALVAGELFPEETFSALVAALTAGLSLAVSGLFWSQALIAEVYTLHTFFLALSSWLLLRWRRHGGLYLPLAGLSLGLGLGNHLTLLFLLPGALLLLSGRRPSWAEGLGGGGLFLAGLAVYLYLPLRAAADPWLNWGDPHDWSAFWAHISAAAYQGLFFRRPWLEVAGNASAAAGFLLRDFAPHGLVLGLAGLFLLGRWEGRTLLLLFFPAVSGLLLALTYGGAGSEVHLLPLYLAWALGCGVTAGALAAFLRGRFGLRAASVALALPLLCFLLIVPGWGRWSLRNDPGPLPEIRTILEGLPPDGLLLTAQDEQTFPLWYAQVVEGIRPDVAVVDVRLLEWPWYRRQLPARNPGLFLPAEAEAGWLEALLRANSGRPVLALSPLPLPR